MCGLAGNRFFHSTPWRVLLFYPFVKVTADAILDAFSAAFFPSERSKMLPNTFGIRCAFCLSLMENYFADHHIAMASAVTKKG